MIVRRLHPADRIMSWPSSFLVGILTAAVGTIAAGVVANLAVGWYRISSFEAGSAAFVVGFALLGLVAGLIIGVATSRLLAGSAPSFLRVLGTAQVVLLGLVAAVGAGARLLADVPPEIDGEELMLAVEVRWPDGHTMSPASDSGNARLRLGSVTRGSHTLRASEEGQLWTSDAKLVDGRWVVPGAVPLFTTRGLFVLDVVLDDQTKQGFLIPLSGHPAKTDLQWSDWYPRVRPGAPPLPNGFTYRYRVQRRSEPLRTEMFGPFEVLTSVNYFFREQPEGRAKPVLAAVASFTVRHRGEPVIIEREPSPSRAALTRIERFEAASAVHGPRPALLLATDPPPGDGVCYLVYEETERLRTERIPDCSATTVRGAVALTSDTAAFAARRRRRVPRGRFDHVTFDPGGLFLLHQTILDTRRLTVRHIVRPTDVSEVPDVPPLSLSPDERSFVRFGHVDGSVSTDGPSTSRAAPSRAMCPSRRRAERPTPTEPQSRRSRNGSTPPSRPASTMRSSKGDAHRGARPAAEVTCSQNPGETR